MLILPPLDCEYGYYKETVENHLVRHNCIPANFWKWMQGQTTALVNGKMVVFANDLINYLKNGGLNAKVTD